MKTYGKVTYIHARDITQVRATQAILTNDVNRKLNARREIVTPIKVTLANSTEFEAFIINRQQAGPGYSHVSLWLTNSQNDEYHFCHDAMRKVAEDFSLPNLICEPMGSGSHRRWAGQRLTEPQFMTSLLLANASQ